MDPGVQFVEEGKPIRDTDLGKVRGIPGVLWAAPLFKGLLSAKLPNGERKTIDLTGIDDTTFIGFPPHMIEGSLSDLKKPWAVFMDFEAAQGRLKMTIPGQKDKQMLKIGDTLEVNDQRAVIQGFCKSTRNFVLQPKVYTTYSRAISYMPSSRRYLTYILVKTKPDVDQHYICQLIQERTKLKAFTSEDFKSQNLWYWLKNTGIPISFGISVLLGFLVGSAIVGQTFYTFILENIKKYAALKAMGLQNMILTKMVLLQAMVVGTIGYGLGTLLATLFGLKFHDSVLAFRMPPILLVFSATGILIIITITSLLSIRKVVKIDPAVVFRG
jgi:putative ABC transport system permease protein